MFLKYIFGVLAVAIGCVLIQRSNFIASLMMDADTIQTQLDELNETILIVHDARFELDKNFDIGRDVDIQTAAFQDHTCEDALDMVFQRANRTRAGLEKVLETLDLSYSLRLLFRTTINNVVYRFMKSGPLLGDDDDLVNVTRVMTSNREEDQTMKDLTSDVKSILSFVKCSCKAVKLKCRSEEPVVAKLDSLNLTKIIDRL